MDYEIIRSRRRTVALEVTREGRVLVRAPLRMPQGEIERFVDGHAAWPGWRPVRRPIRP